MIQVKIHDTIVDIIEKIEAQPTGDVVLDISLGHPILHNYLSLKILKSKVWDNRKLIIATSDRIGKKIGKQLDIEYSLIKDKNFIEKESKTSLLHHNYTFWEYLKFQLKSYFREFRWMLERNKKLNSLWKYSRMYQEKTSLHIFIGFLVFSLAVFMFIYYFAVSKTHVYITPEIIIKKDARNFIFKENVENSILHDNKMINIEVFTQKVFSSEEYNSTWIEQVSPLRSRGKIQVSNEIEWDSQVLIIDTRFQTADGVVFRSTKEHTLPSAIRDNFWQLQPGTIEIEVEADTKDAHGEYIGTRWDIRKNTPLFLPALSAEQQKQIYAESIEDFSGGVDNFQKIVGEDDILHATQLLEEKLKTEALAWLKQQIQMYNTTNNTTKEILSGPYSQSYTGTTLSVEQDTEPWQQKDSFFVNGSTTLYAYIYDREDIIQKLKNNINERHLEGVEKISHIDSDSLRMSNIIYSKENPFELKATFEIESRFLHDFLHEDNTYINHLKSQIRGLPQEEAEKILLNDSNISNVDIRIRPFFVNRVSNIPNNIIFKIREN